EIMINQDRPEAQFYENAGATVGDDHIAGDTGVLPAVVQPDAERRVADDEVALDQAIAERVDFDAAGLEIGQGEVIGAGGGAIVADDVADDADIVGVPGGDTALDVVGDEIRFDEVMAADEDVLV